MFESSIKKIKDCIDYCVEYFKEDHEQNKRIYLKKLASLLDLICDFLVKYNGYPVSLKNCCFYDENAKSNCYLNLIITEESREWEIVNDSKKISNQELAQKCWDSDVKMKNFIVHLIEKISQNISEKKRKLESTRKKYMEDLDSIQQATKEIKTLLNEEISEEIQNT